MNILLKGATYTFEDGISVYAYNADDADKKHEKLKANYQHQETENENYFEEMNNYLDGTMNV